MWLVLDLNLWRNVHISSLRKFLTVQRLHESSERPSIRMMEVSCEWILNSSWPNSIRLDIICNGLLLRTPHGMQM